MESNNFRKCVPLYPGFMTPEDTHTLCVICLGAEYASSVLEGAECVHCKMFSVKQLCSCLSLFLREEERVSAPWFGPCCCWGFDLGSWEVEKSLAADWTITSWRTMVAPPQWAYRSFWTFTLRWKGLGRNHIGYVRMRPLEEMLTSYLSQSKVSSLRALVLHVRPSCYV